MMKCSIITASFNPGKLILPCLESVFSQVSHGTLLEHIIVDGVSTDGTVERLSEWDNNHPSTSDSPHPPYSFKYLSEPDRGQCDAFNKGVSIATGEWICWLNADDKLAPDAVAAFQRALTKNPTADVIYGHVQFIHEDATPAWISYHLPYLYPLILNGCYVPPSSGTFFRRDLFLRQPLDVDYHYVMDMEWFLRCGRHLKAILIDEVFSCFRISANAKTSEMILSGQITERHREERETYRRKYIYSQWPELTEDQARREFEQRRKWYMLLYYTLKLRYAWRYLQNRRS